MDVQTLNILAYLSLIIAAVSLLVVTANPYRLRRVSTEAFGTFMPATTREELFSLADAWAGRARISNFQLRLLSIMGIVVGIIAGLLTRIALSDVWAAVVFIVVSALLYYYPKQRFLKGFPKEMIFHLEREAPIFAAFMHRSIGITGLSVQVSFEQFMEVHPDKATTKLLYQIPEGVPYPDALLDLGLPTVYLNNWMQVVQALASISDFGNPEEVLRDVRDRIRKREEQYLRQMIKRKSFAAPAVTVVVMLPGLMAILLGSIILQAFLTLTGGF